MSDAPLEHPLERNLAPVLDEARMQAIGRKVRAARHPSPRPRRLQLLAFGTGLAIVVLGWRLMPARSTPVGLSDGTALPQSVTAAALPETWRLSDGSAVSLRPHSSAEVIANRPESITMLIHRGKARFEVNPRAERRWFIEAGLLTVEVVGTVLSVERSPAGVSVHVEHGVVVVRSELLPNRIQRLEAGESTFVATPAPVPGAADVEGPRAPGGPNHTATPPPVGGQSSAAPPPSPSDAPSSPPAVVSPLPRPGTAKSGRAATGGAWKKALASGDFNRAWSAIQRAGLDRVMSEATPDELFALADAARGTAHHEEAARVLEFLLARGDLNDSTAASAAFTLGRLELDDFGRPLAAAVHFARASQFAPIAEDALLRRCQALWVAGHDKEAREVARSVVTRFPHGVQTPRLKGWLDGTTDAPWRR